MMRKISAEDARNRRHETDLKIVFLVCMYVCARVLERIEKKSRWYRKLAVTLHVPIIHLVHNFNQPTTECG